MLTTVKARYENGNITWLEKPPANNADIVVVFSTEKKIGRDGQKMTTEEALNLLSRFKGCIEDNNFDYEQEREDWLNEKYGYSD